jgi:hypothetical protein
VFSIELGIRLSFVKTLEFRGGGLNTPTPSLSVRHWSASLYAVVTNPTKIETIRLNRLRCFGHVQRMEENRIPKKVLYMNLETG